MRLALVVAFLLSLYHPSIAIPTHVRPEDSVTNGRLLALARRTALVHQDVTNVDTQTSDDETGGNVSSAANDTDVDVASSDSNDISVDGSSGNSTNDDSVAGGDLGFDVVELPTFKECLTLYLPKGKRSDVVFHFDKLDSSDPLHIPTLKIRGGGYWDEEIDCRVVNATSALCDLPAMPMTGTVSFTVQFGRATLDATPFLPVNHYIMVHAAKILAVKPNVLSRLGDLRTINLTTEGLFKDMERMNGENLMFEIRSGRQAIRVPYNTSGPFKAFIQLPQQIQLSRWVPYVTVDGGISWEGSTAAETSFTVYEPRFDSGRLKVSPPAGPVSGGTPVTVDGVYGLHLAPNVLRVKLVNMYQNGGGEQKTHSVIVRAEHPVNTNMPPITFTAPPTLIPGYYSIYFSELAEEPRVWTAVPGLMFLYYDVAIEAISPISSSIYSPAQSISLFASEFPRTGNIMMQFGESRVTPDGAEFMYQHNVSCDTNYGVNEQVPSNDDTLDPVVLETITCDLPLSELGRHPTKGTTLTMSVSLNGVDFGVPLPVSQFRFFDASADTIMPSSGPGQGGNVVTIFGQGFIDLPNMAVRLESTGGDVAPRVVPATFEGEGMISFVAPQSTATGNSDTVTVTLMMNELTGSAINIGPTYTYANTLPVLVSLQLDPGNRFSDRVAVTDSEIIVRVQTEGSLAGVDVVSFSIGSDEMSSMVTAAPAGTAASTIDNTTWTRLIQQDESTTNASSNTSNDKPSIASAEVDMSTWVLRYVVKDGDMGPLTFTLSCKNELGNSLTVQSNDPMADKSIEVDASTPEVTSIQVETDNAKNDGTVGPGNTMIVFLTFDRPLRVLQMTDIIVGSDVLDTEIAAVQTIGSYPSATWKITYPLASSAQVQGGISASIAAVGVYGNILESLKIPNCAVGTKATCIPLEVVQPEYPSKNKRTK